MEIKVTTVVLLLGTVASTEHRHGSDYHRSDYYAPPHYEFEYSVHDPHTGDVKRQHEVREGDVVRGFYSLKEADGTTREVHYSSDKHAGFNAIVKRLGHATHPRSHRGGHRGGAGYARR